MGSKKLKGKDLKNIGYGSDRSRSLAVGIMASADYKYLSKQEKLGLLSRLRDKPEDYLEDKHLGILAGEFIQIPLSAKREELALRDFPKDFSVFGRRHIASNALQQMEMAMRLPIAEEGALMPDSHQGYGLPIGGVLAARGAVIPYAVGLDIGCRMSLSIYDVRPDYLRRYAHQLKVALKSKTCFGTGGELGIVQEHPVLERDEFRQLPLLKQLHGKAVRQLGTSGSGNHFVEFGTVTLGKDNGLCLAAGDYVGLLSHSGSRGFGAAVARHYSDLAKEHCLLPRQVRHLAWLDMESEEGQEYWMAMNLAGDYAKACHDQIHWHLGKHLGLSPVVNIENHHNFAWKELQEDGRELIVHRKGATPAAKGVLGIIPGSMTAAGYIVRGKGHTASLSSASHGAGRKMSRQKARASFTGSALKKLLSQAGVALIGGGIDEAPIAYKDLEGVMLSQKELVEVIGKFSPKIVRMDKN